MSDADALWLKEITIRRMPGFPHGGLRITDLAPGINILFGPNGAGKTTLARAIQKGMAPGTEPKIAEVELLCQAGREAWSVEVRDQTVAVLQNGGPARNPLELPPQDTPRYILSLPELIASDKGVEFATLIQREAAGGYDVGQAAKELRFNPAPAEPQGKSRELANALRGYNASVAAQKEAADRVARLADLRRRYEDQKRAQSEAALLEASIRLRTAEVRRAEFPETVALVTVGDDKRLETLQNETLEWEEQLEKHQSDLRSADAAAAAQQLQKAVDSAWLDSLAARLAEITDLEGQLREIRLQRDAARYREQKERESLAGSADEANLHELVLNEEFWRESHQAVEESASCRERRRAMDELQSALQPPESAPDTETCKEAIDCLRQWLAAPDRSSSDRRLPVAIAALALSVMAIGLLVWRGGVFWSFLLVAPTILAFLLALQAAHVDERVVAEQNWRRLRQQPPAAWTRDVVEQLLRQREQQFVELQLDAARFVRWQATAVDRETLDAAEHAAASRSEAVRAKFGLAPTSDGASGITLLARFDALRSWRDAERAAEDAEARIKAIESNIATTLRPVASALLPFGYDGLTDSHEAGEGLQKLKARSSEFERSAKRCADLRLDIEAARAKRARAEERITAFYEERKLQHGDMLALRAALAARVQFEAAHQELQAAEIAVHEACTQCSQAGVEPNALLDKAQRMTDADATAELRQLRESADHREETFKEITEIEVTARQFRDGHALEDALLGIDRLRSALVWQRDENVAAAVGSMVATWAEGLARESTEPPVQARARELFALFTNSRYRLDLTKKGEPAFCATDTTSRRSHTLDELSSGTRAQLLMAVRLAFIETQERGPRLPIVLDEVLANSDSERANAIMLAAARIAAEGRQVFYLTAQAEEVHRWQEALRIGAFPEAVVVDILLARRAESQRLQPWSPAPVPLPSPEGKTSAEYATLVGVPGIDPRAEVSNVHLWYFEPEPSALYRLMVRGYFEWGPLAEALDQDLAAAVSAQAAEGYRATARALAEILELAGIGRGKPVTRQSLIDGGISPKFIDRVDQVAGSCDRDATALIAALTGGEVKGLQRRYCDALNQYLLENDYFSRDDKASEDECVRKCVARRASDMASGLLSPEAIRRLVAFVYSRL